MAAEITYRKIRSDEKQALQKLVDAVIGGLERKEFFIALDDGAIDEMLDGTKAISYGAYDGDRLVGTAQLYLGDAYVDAVKNQAGLIDKKAAELGGALVLKEYRGRGIMKKLASILVKEAENINYDYIVSTAHPENIASQKGLISCGEHLVKTAKLNGYERNIYAKSLTSPV